jgi:hypothetical protein
MGKIDTKAAFADLFDLGGASQPGERQAAFDEYWSGSISASVAAKAAPQKSFTLSCDPSHGWLLVTDSDMLAVGLSEADITPYSYRSGGWIALEEDCDAGTFISAYKAKYGTEPKIVYDEKGARIRGWKGYGAKPKSW